MSLTRSLTRPLTRKISRADLTQGFGGSFSPFALDPYLLFDARDSMVGTLENPTLDLNPALPETLDVITATRAGIATYTDPDGNIATASADTVRVDYTQGDELTPTKFQNIGYTDFSSGWSLSSMTSVAGAGFQGNPSVVLTSTSANGFKSFLVTTVAGQSYTASFYIKRITGSGAIKFINWDSEPNQPPPDISSQVSSEWSRVTVNFFGRSGGGSVYFGVRCVTSGDVVEIAMPQVEEGTTASSFVENTTGSPKFITGATYGPRVPMILVEPSATNLLTATQEVSSWSSSNVSVTSNTTIAPDGSLSGDTVTRTTSGAVVRQTKAVTSGTSYTMSIFAKAETDNQLQLDFSNSSMGLDNVEFNTRTGQKVSGSNNYTITELANGWRRYSFTSTCISSGNTAVKIRIENDEPVQLWGFQFEEGSVPTSYIPHISGSTVTRAADDLVISGSDFDFYNQSEGTFYVESVPNENTSGSFLFDLTKISGGSERLLIYNGGSNQKVYISTASTNWVDKIIGTRPAGGVLSRVAISYETNNVQASLDGVNMVPDPSATMSTSIAKMTIGNRYETSRYLNGRIRRLIFWPYSSDRL